MKSEPECPDSLLSSGSQPEAEHHLRDEGQARELDLTTIKADEPDHQERSDGGDRDTEFPTGDLSGKSEVKPEVTKGPDEAEDVELATDEKGKLV